MTNAATQVFTSNDLFTKIVNLSHKMTFTAKLVSIVLNSVEHVEMLKRREIRLAAEREEEEREFEEFAWYSDADAMYEAEFQLQEVCRRSRHYHDDIVSDYGQDDYYDDYEDEEEYYDEVYQQMNEIDGMEGEDKWQHHDDGSFVVGLKCEHGMLVWGSEYEFIDA